MPDYNSVDGFEDVQFACPRHDTRGIAIMSFDTESRMALFVPSKPLTNKCPSGDRCCSPAPDRIYRARAFQHLGLQFRSRLRGHSRQTSIAREWDVRCRNRGEQPTCLGAALERRPAQEGRHTTWQTRSRPGNNLGGGESCRLRAASIWK